MVRKIYLLALCALVTAFSLLVPQAAFAVNGAESSLMAGSETAAVKVASFKDGAFCLKNASVSSVALAVDKGTRVASAKAGKGNAQKFYLRNEGNGLVSLQSVSTGQFLGEQDGQVVQLADSKDAHMRWRLAYDNKSTVLTIVNAASNAVLSLDGDKATSGASATVQADVGNASQRWSLSSAKLVSNGYYEMKSDYGTYLDIKDSSYAYSANVRAYSHKSTGAQTFHIYERKSSGFYYIENNKSRLVLDVNKSSKKNKANVIQSKKTANASALWKPALDRSGKLVFVNKKSGKALESKSSKKGANVRQNKVTAGKRGQLWRLQSTSKRFSLSGDAKLDKYVRNILHSKKTLHDAYIWTVNHGYRNGQRYWSNPHVLSDELTISLAKDFCKYKSGNCYRFAATFSWLARGLGYNTKVISGWVQSTSGGRAPHGWVEVRKGGQTYVCDPDLQLELPSYGWYMTTYATSPTEYHSW